MKEIQLTQGKVALVDDDLFDFLNQWKWYVLKRKSRNTFYAARQIRVNGLKKTLKMHHHIIGHPLKGWEIDHLDGNGWNNIKDNLRITTSRGNSQNKKYYCHKKKTSIYPGVCWEKFTKKWKSEIFTKGNRKNLGRYTTEIEAFQAYTQACREIGEPCMILTI